MSAAVLRAPLRNVAAPPSTGGLHEGARRALAAARLWRRRRFERAELACMTERALSDIGMSRIDAWQESNKPFWRP